MVVQYILATRCPRKTAHPSSLSLVNSGFQLSETAQLTVLQALNGHIKATATNSSNRLDHMHDRSTDQLLTVSVRRVTTGRYINTYWRQLTKASQSSSIVIGTLEEPLQSSTLCLLDYQIVEDHYEKSKSLTIANLLKRFPAISSHTSSRRRLEIQAAWEKWRYSWPSPGRRSPRWPRAETNTKNFTLLCAVKC